MSDKTKNEAPVIVPQVTKAQDHKYVYVNHGRGQATAFDIQLTCGRMSFDSNLVPGLEEQITLIMSVAEAKSIRDILEITIKQYEQLFGEIPYSDAHKPAPLPGPPQK